MKEEDAKKLAASIFQMELECMRGTWDIEKENEEFIKFAENFKTNVEKYKKLKGIK